MAWRSSGLTNDDMVNKLKRFGVIHSDAVEDAFRQTDRRFFVPPGQTDAAHADRPLKDGDIHISAPHIYGTVLEALELTSGSSFLNVGSGTGYLTCMVSHIMGPTSVSINIECLSEALEHSQAAVQAWKADRTLPVPEMQFYLGNVLQLDTTTGECLQGFDRIYVGAALEKSNLEPLANLLKVGGILVGPVDDELVKVVRVGKSLGGNRPRVPRSFRGQPPPLSDEFYQQILSAVRFSPLVKYPAIPVTIPSMVWSPSVHCHYPSSFRKASDALLLCSKAPVIQPPPAKVQDRVNVAPLLPQAMWAEILSYTHRDWFEEAQSSEEFLRRRLMEEQSVAKQAQEARSDAETRLHLAERERDVYRLLALRWQTRLQVAMGEVGGSAAGDNHSVIGADDIAQVSAAVFADEPTMLGLGGLSVMMRRFQAENSDGDDDEVQDSDRQSHMEDDSDSDDSGGSMEDETTEMNGIDDSESMAMSPTSQSMSVRPQARTVSITSEDL